MIHSFKNPLILLLLMVLLVSISCVRERNQPGYAYMADFDMYYSIPYEVYTANPVFTDNLTMRTPVKGTVPRGYMPYPYAPRSVEEQQLAGLELVNPLEPSKETLLEGKLQYEVYCQICHGAKGDGKGHLYTSGKFVAMPTDLKGDYIRNKPDGEIYHIITHGSISSLMGAHGSQILPDNRWKIIHYVRELGK